MIMPVLVGAVTVVFVIAAWVRGAPWPGELLGWPTGLLGLLTVLLGGVAWLSSWFALTINADSAPVFDLMVMSAFALVVHFVFAQVLAALLMRVLRSQPEEVRTQR